MSWKYLSYSLNSETYGYGNGDRFELNQIRSMCCGDTSNNSEFKMPTHFGTHIDYPFHFDSHGKTSSDYIANDFIFTSIKIIEVVGEVDDYIIKNKNLRIDKIDSTVDFLIVKTGFTYKRNTNEYWEKGFGFHPETANYLKHNFPNIKCIGFDLISLNSYKNRPLGRISHKAFLKENDILIVEEMDLRNISENSIIKQLIIAPLQLEQADGAPCTILAQIDED